MRSLSTFVGRSRFWLRKLKHSIGPNDFVIDVGSGGDPHPRANVIVDRELGSSAERTFAFRQSATAVIADIEALPFCDNAFDFAICSHVLEHVSDPAKAAAELSRVSKAGYIETPSDIHERMFPIGWHNWFVRKDGDILHFTAKPTPFLDERLGDFFRKRWMRDKLFMQWFWKHADQMFVRHYWRGDLKVNVEGKLEWSLPASDDSSDGHDPVDSPMKRRVYEMLAMLKFRKNSPSM